MDQGWVVFWMIAAVLIWAAVYAVECAVWPFAACRKCDGAGRFRSPSGRAWRRCRRCKGSGERVRLGRRAWTKLNEAKKSAVG